jgi:hypothetical protein
MAPNLLLLAFTPEMNSVVADTAEPSRWHRFYDFIVQSQTRRAEHEIASYMQRTRQAPRP